jgi:hypothetical protein
MKTLRITSVNGALASLALAVSESVPPQAQWGLNWIVGGVKHELYVEDDIGKGDIPTLLTSQK